MLLPGAGRAFRAGPRAAGAGAVPHARHDAAGAAPAAAGAISRAERRSAILLLEIAIGADDRADRPSGRWPAFRPRAISSRRRWASPSPRPVDPTQGGQAAAVGNFLTMLGRDAPVRHRRATTLSSPPSAAATSCCRPARCPPSGDAAKLALDHHGQGLRRRGADRRALHRVRHHYQSWALACCRGSCRPCRCSSSAMPATIMLGFLFLAAVIGMMMTAFLKELSELPRPFVAR